MQLSRACATGNSELPMPRLRKLQPRTCKGWAQQFPGCPGAPPVWLSMQHIPHRSFCLRGNALAVAEPARKKLLTAIECPLCSRQEACAGKRAAGSRPAASPGMWHLEADEEKEVVLDGEQQLRAPHHTSMLRQESSLSQAVPCQCTDTCLCRLHACAQHMHAQ